MTQDIEFTFEDNSLTGYVTAEHFRKVILPDLVKISGEEGYEGRYRVKENDRVLTVRVKVDA